MGSGNFSKSAFDNLENCIILDNEQIINLYEENFCHILYRIHSRTSPVPSNFHTKTSPT
jgi:hypothetical protein